MINSVPLGTHRTFSDYTKFLIQRFIIPRFKQGSQSVHVIFDNPGRLPQTPKSCERARHDVSAPIHEGHTCDTIESQMSLPKKWLEGLINCRTCKRSLVLFLSGALLKTAQSSLEQGQRLVVAGGFQGDLQDTAWYVESPGVLQPDPTLKEKTDTRVWRHVQQTTGSKCLVVSPDTDVYMIGLLLYHGENKDIIVQINPYNKREVQYNHSSPE